MIVAHRLPGVGAMAFGAAVAHTLIVTVPPDSLIAGDGFRVALVALGAAGVAEVLVWGSLVGPGAVYLSTAGLVALSSASIAAQWDSWTLRPPLPLLAIAFAALTSWATEGAPRVLSAVAPSVREALREAKVQGARAASQLAMLRRENDEIRGRALEDQRRAADAIARADEAAALLRSEIAARAAAVKAAQEEKATRSAPPTDAFAGRYEKIRRLPGARGGSGAEMWIAWDHVAGAGQVPDSDQGDDERIVALKIFPFDTFLGRGRDPSELGILSQLYEAHAGNPNVVKVIQAAYDRNEPFIAMEYVATGNLRDWLAAHPVVTISEILTIGGGVLKGLVGAHDRRVVHSDVKPANVLMRGATPVVTDFDIAVRVGNGPVKVNRRSGWYAPVEQGTALGDQFKVDRSADVYGVGALLHLLLTGTAPWEAYAPAGTDPGVFLARTAIHAVSVPDPTLVNPAVPVPLAQLLARWLATDPSARPEDARAAIAQLTEVAKRVDITQTINRRALPTRAPHALELPGRPVQDDAPTSPMRWLAAANSDDIPTTPRDLVRRLTRKDRT